MRTGVTDGRTDGQTDGAADRQGGSKKTDFSDFEICFNPDYLVSKMDSL